ncbi:MAG: ABC transporter permease [Leucobacter sp.]
MTTQTEGTRALLLPKAKQASMEKRRANWTIIIPVVFLLILFLYPVFGLLARSFNDPEWGMQNYVRIFTDGYSLVVIGRTLLVAFVVTLVTLLIAYPFAYTMTVVSDKTRNLMTAVILLPFWTSAIVRSFAWVILLQPNGPLNSLLRSLGLPPLEILGTAAGVTLAMSQVLLPFMALPLFNSMNAIDSRVMSAAASLGAPPIVRFFKVYLPLSVPGVVAGSVIVFILSLGFFITPALLGSPKESMVAQLMTVQVQQNLNFGVAGALATVLLLSAGVIISVAMLLVGKKGGSISGAVGGQVAR